MVVMVDTMLIVVGMHLELMLPKGMVASIVEDIPLVIVLDMLVGIVEHILKELGKHEVVRNLLVLDHMVVKDKDMGKHLEHLEHHIEDIRVVIKERR